MNYKALLPFQLTICGIDELACHCAGDVTHVLSILDPGWPELEPLSIFDVNRRLRLHFHDVIEARSGEEGIQLFKSEKVDVVILNYWMSGMKGTAVASELKSINPAVPIIVLSGMSDLPGEAS